MNSTTHKERFFAALPKMDAQFGNLITLREKDGLEFPGLHQVFIASIIQFQPLLEVTLLDARGSKMEWTRREQDINPVEGTGRFEAAGISLVQRTVVQGDEVLLELELLKTGENAGEPVHIEFSGAGLFSPQGVPYHWDEEKRISWSRSGTRELRGEWREEVRFALTFSESLDSLDLKPLGEEDIRKDLYFNSFNLKKRYTYWVSGERRSHLSGDSDTSSRNTGYCGLWTPSFDEKGRASLAVRFSLSAGSFGIPPVPGKDYTEKKESLTRSWERFIEGIPRFSCGDPDLERIYYTSWFVLQAGRISLTRERFDHPFTSVNKFHYYNQFFWDSAFHAIAWLWYNGAEPAESEMKNFVTNQWRNGMIPYELFMYTINGREWMDGDALTTATTQPPVIGITIREIFNKFRNKDYPAYFYESLLKYENWLSLYRDLGNRGLCCYVNVWESGCDNSPRFDKAARNRILDPYIESVDFNVFIYQLRKTILDMAEWLELPEPPKVRERMEQSRQSMNELMYREEDGFYYDLEAGTSEQVSVKAASGLFPLMTDIPDPEQKKRLVEEFLMSESEFLVDTPVPSVSRSEPSYDPRDFWRGANWPQYTWSVLYGIRDSHPAEAGELLDRFLSTTSGNANCYEYYHSETGEGAGLPFQGWGALYTDFIIRYVAGINPSEKGFRFHPLSKRYKSFSLEGLDFRGMTLSIIRDGEEWEFKWEGVGSIRFSGIESFDAEFEEGLSIRFPGEESRDLVVPDGNYRWDGKVLYFK